jgi:hypothetical protein
VGIPHKGLPFEQETLSRARPRDDDRVAAIDGYCDLIGSLPLKIINTVIVKPRITSPRYQVLDTALKYSVQRIENDLDPVNNPQSRFLIISDPGRIGKMRKTTRRVQRINYIPSRFGPAAYRREIRSLIEDPLQKDSSQSYFIQSADVVSFVAYLYGMSLAIGGPLPSRIPSAVNADRVADWMDQLRPSLNLKASGRDPYGVVFHP